MLQIIWLINYQQRQIKIWVWFIVSRGNYQDLIVLECRDVKFMCTIQIIEEINCKLVHYNKRGLFCDPNIIANNKERCFRNATVANHNSSQILKLLRYHNIRTRTIASPSQLPNLIQSPNFSDYNCFYPLFAINITSETIFNKPITVTT
jgi:hypothetical protein